MDATIVTLLYLSTLMTLHGTTAQKPIPDRPKLSNSFSLGAAVEYYGGSGQITLASDFDAGKNYQLFLLTSSGSVQAAIGRMTQYDTEKDYIIANVGPVVGCIPLPISGSKPSTGMWDWVENAVYDGRSSKVTGEPLDFWASNKNGVVGEIRVGVSPQDPNTPMVLWYKGSGYSLTTDLLYVITDYEPGKPPNTAFTIPVTCNESRYDHDTHSSSMPPMGMPPFVLDLTGKHFKNIPAV